MKPTNTPLASNNGPTRIITPPPSGGIPKPQLVATTNLNAPTLTLTLRSTFLLAAFVALILQVHVTFDKVIQSSGVASCHEDHAHAPPANHQQVRERKPLPSITDQGMILVFLHIPKTGGTSMSEPFVHHPEWRYRMVYGPKKQANYSQEMTATLKNWKPGTKIFYEYHGGRSSPYMNLEVRDDLQIWRKLAELRRIPFFAFTVFREPMSFAISHFNFYYANRQKDDNRYYYVPNPTEEDFVSLSLPNPQCLFCVSSEVAYYKEWRQDKHKTIHTTQDQCDNVYEAFLQDLDWIGLTDNLSTETFPMIEQIANITFVTHQKNKSKDKIKKGNLTEHALQHIQNITRWDKSIYIRAQRDFPCSEMWTNFQPKPKSVTSTKQ